ncbi:MAG TPA: hypothetical protein VMW42_09440 [Desulfatiglandales bacterium]|nr:hypothetical protein [Desulfatiglandales bacterium]
MRKNITFLIVVALLCWALPCGAEWKVSSEKTISGFGHPESVAFDPLAQVLYVSRFGPDLNPIQKDEMGFISLIDLNGKMLEERFLPGPGGLLNKPKGVWVNQGLLWTADIDSVWVFDLKTKNGQRVSLPGANFANDLVANSGKLFVSDTVNGTIYAVEPADFLTAIPKVDPMIRKSGLSPNGLWINNERDLLVGTAPSGDSAGRIYKLKKQGMIEPISPELGRIDGLAVLSDGTILYTDWKGKGLFELDKNGQIRLLAGGFDGPADFAVVSRADGYLIVVPDLVKGDLRFFTINK